MYKYIVIGHGEFPLGVISSFEMLSGETNKLEMIQFDKNKDFEVFKKELTDKLSSYERWIMFTDIVGGSPMQTALGHVLTVKDKNSIVISGFNISLLLDVYFKIGEQNIKQNEAEKIINESVEQAREMMNSYSFISLGGE